MKHAPITPRPEWYRNAGVLDCDECDGQGFFDHEPWRHANDPDRYDVPCKECDETGLIPCATCGYETRINAVDCLACDTVHMLTDAELRALDVDAFVKAFRASVEAARDEAGQAYVAARLGRVVS